MKNAKANGLISDTKPYIAKTNRGVHFLQVCVNNDDHK